MAPNEAVAAAINRIAVASSLRGVLDFFDRTCAAIVRVTSLLSAMGWSVGPVH